MLLHLLKNALGLVVQGIVHRHRKVFNIGAPWGGGGCQGSEYCEGKGGPIFSLAVN